MQLSVLLNRKFSIIKYESPRSFDLGLFLFPYTYYKNYIKINMILIELKNLFLQKRTNQQIIEQDICDNIVKLYKNNEIVNNTWELLDVKLNLSPYEPYLNIFRTLPTSYLEKEHKWYMSKKLSIKGYMDDITIWKNIASKDDKQTVNSNYGWCVFSEENGSQFDNCLSKLKKDKFTREAMIIYTRPSIYKDAVENRKSGFYLH